MYLRPVSVWALTECICPKRGEVPGPNLGGSSETVIKIFCFKEKIRASKSPETVDLTVIRN